MHPLLSVSARRIEAVLPREVGSASRRWATRSALVVTLEDASGQRGVGEIAPLPGLSDERLEDAEAILAELGESLDPTELDLASLPPSVRFGLEAALLELRAGERPAFEALLDDVATRRVPEALELQVLLDELDTARAHAEAAFSRGARTFKVKLGREGRAHDEALLLRQLRELSPALTIRVDANGLPLDREALLPALQQVGVEYVEDPGPEDRERLAQRLPQWVGVPLAIDAPMIVDPHLALAHASALGARVVVLKPTLLGGLEATLSLAARARARGYRVVLSHALESPVGLAALAHLALAASAACHRALFGAQGLAPWPGVDAFRYVDTGEPLQLPYFLSESRLERPSSAGFGL